jgi:hypothetical protein
VLVGPCLGTIGECLGDEQKKDSSRCFLSVPKDGDRLIAKEGREQGRREEIRSARAEEESTASSPILGHQADRYFNDEGACDPSPWCTRRRDENRKPKTN